MRFYVIRLSLVIFAITLLCSSTSVGQRFPSHGIREIPAPIPDLAIASYDQFGPVIYYNLAFVRRAGPALSAFIRTHEYGHHILGHLQRSRFARNPYEHTLLHRDAEIQADRFATDYWLENDPDVLADVIRAFESPYTGNLGDMTHLPTPTRAKLIRQWVAENESSSCILTAEIGKTNYEPDNDDIEIPDIEIDDIDDFLKKQEDNTEKVYDDLDSLLSR